MFFRKNTNNHQNAKSSLARKQPNLRYESLETRELMAADLFSSSIGAQPLLPSASNDAPTAMISTRVIGTGIQGPVVISDKFDPIGPVLPPGGAGTPAFDGSAELSGGILRIHGSSSPDRILIQEMTNSNGVQSIHVTVENIEGDEVLRKSFLKPFVNKIFAYGHYGPDVITNNSYVESSLEGGIGNDTLIGGWADDVLYGNQGHDRLIGRGGNDNLQGQNGNDTYVFAGSRYLGEDIINSFEDTSVRGYQEGHDTIDFSGLRQSVYGFARYHVVQASGVTFDLDQADTQQVNGQLSLTLDNLRDRLGKTRVTNLIGTNYADTLSGDDAGNLLDGRGGNDLLVGLGGDDVLLGGSGHDRLLGDAGRDRLDGGGGNDFLSGRQGDDSYVFAGRTSLGQDEIDEAGGSDTYDFSGLGESIYLNLGSTGDSTGRIRPNSLVTINANTRLPNVENIIGTDYVDILIGNEFDNRLQGNGDNDVLFGKGGDDGLFGGSGTDWLDGGAGNDGIWTGSGDDRAFGRAGVDRFHVHEDYDSGDITDEDSSSDVRVNYSNGGVRTNDFGTYLPGIWQDRDVESIDQAFAKLQEETGNTALLKPQRGGDYEFVRQGNGVGSANDYNAFFQNATDTVFFNQNAFSSTSDKTQKVVIHELAHAWDQTGENSFVTDFQLLSGWTDQSPAADELDKYEKSSYKFRDFWYLKDAGFVSDYAKTNPREDFAETVEAYFADKYELRHGLKIDDTTAPKLQLIEAWTERLSIATTPVIVMPRIPIFRSPGTVFRGQIG